MRSNLFWVTVLMAVASISSAFAEDKMGRVFIEPDVGYALAGSMGSSGAPADSFKGLSVGGRAGVRLGSVFMIGPSFKYLPSISYTPNGATTALSTNPKAMTLGGFAGLSFPRIRIWGGYNFMDSLENFAISDPTLGDGVLKIKGSSIFFGAGIRVVGPISINGEYVIPSYTKYTGTIAGIALDDTFATKVTGKYVVVSISAPISF